MSCHPSSLTSCWPTVAPVGFGRLALSADERASMQIRRELMALAGALTYMRGGGAATISMRFARTREPYT